MSWSREADDAFSRLLGCSQDSLDRIHRKADEYREAYIAAGRPIRPQLSLEEAWAEIDSYGSDSDCDEQDLALISPPMTPKGEDRGPQLSSSAGTFHPSDHQRLCDSPEPWEASSNAPSHADQTSEDEVSHPLPTPRHSLCHGQGKSRKPKPIDTSVRLTRSKSSSRAISFFELSTNGRTGRNCSTVASPTSDDFHFESTTYSGRRGRTTQRSQQRRSKYRITKR